MSIYYFRMIVEKKETVVKDPDNLLFKDDPKE